MRGLLNDLSYRVKVPLGFTLIIALAGSAITAVLIAYAYAEIRQDAVHRAAHLGQVMARTLAPAIKHDDLWQAYQAITPPPGVQDPHDPHVLVLDTNARVFASNRPRQIAATPPDILDLLHEPLAVGDFASGFVHGQIRDLLYVLVPIGEPDARFGTLVMLISTKTFLPRFRAVATRAALTSVAVLGLLLPLGWFVGKRIADPLVDLAGCLGTIGRCTPGGVGCQVRGGQDEIGRLGRECQRMIKELQHKQLLEEQVIAAERLAAVGQLTAGIAHEINNPLGGMLNAISTYRHYGGADPATERTLSLIERGLLQIKESVSALLVEARPRGRTLLTSDLEDVRTLILPDVERQGARLDWRASLPTPLLLPAGPVRQILINLLLNAAKAVEPGGQITCRVRTRGQGLLLTVANSGATIPEEQRNRLFEPFTRFQPGGTGLGLWVTYQIVQQLDGRIRVLSAHGRTRFTVSLPCERTHAP